MFHRFLQSERKTSDGKSQPKAPALLRRRFVVVHACLGARIPREPWGELT